MASLFSSSSSHSSSLSNTLALSLTDPFSHALGSMDSDLLSPLLGRAISDSQFLYSDPPRFPMQFSTSVEHEQSAMYMWIYKELNDMKQNNSIISQRQNKILNSLRSINQLQKDLMSDIKLLKDVVAKSSSQFGFPMSKPGSGHGILPFKLTTAKSSDTALSSSEYPKVNYWTRKDWTHKKSQNVTVLYIEDENGKPVDGYRLTDIRSFARSLWISLAEAGLVPASWTKASSIVSEHYRCEMCLKFPELRLWDSNWKADQIAYESYSHWRTNYRRPGKYDHIKEEEASTNTLPKRQPKHRRSASVPTGGSKRSIASYIPRVSSLRCNIRGLTIALEGKNIVPARPDKGKGRADTSESPGLGDHTTHTGSQRIKIVNPLLSVHFGPPAAFAATPATATTAGTAITVANQSTGDAEQDRPSGRSVSCTPIGDPPPAISTTTDEPTSAIETISPFGDTDLNVLMDSTHCSTIKVPVDAEPNTLTSAENPINLEHAPPENDSESASCIVMPPLRPAVPESDSSETRPPPEHVSSLTHPTAIGVDAAIASSSATLNFSSNGVSATKTAGSVKPMHIGKSNTAYNICAREWQHANPKGTSAEFKAHYQALSKKYKELKKMMKGSNAK
ncbi:hypothetical protein BKA93DRAFT_828516 [Sparassis latifolia]